MNTKQTRTLVAAILIGFAGLFSGISMIGQTMTLAKVLTLFFTGLACGASILATLRPKK